MEDIIKGRFTMSSGAGLQCPVEQMFLTVYLVYCMPEFIALFST